MYSVYAGNTCIYDDTSTASNIRLINPVLELADNMAGSFKMTVPVTNVGYNIIERLTTNITVYKDGEEMWAGRVIDETIDFWKNRTLVCEGELAFLNDSTQPPAEYHNMTVRGFLETLINIHNSKVAADRRFTVGAVTVTDPNDSLYRYTNFEKTIECINEKLLDSLGGHLSIRKQNGTRYLDYLADKVSYNTQVIEFGLNLMDYAASYNMTEFATVLVPLGERLEESPIEALDAYLTVSSVNNNSIYVQNTEAVQNYGWIEKVVHFDRVTEPSNLLRKARQYLSDVQFNDMILEVKAVDLHYMNPSIEGVKLTDQIRVVSQPHGLDRIFPVMKLSIPLDQPENTQFTLGSKITTTYTAANNKVNSEIMQRLDEIPERQGELKESVLTEAQANAAEIMNLVSNGFVTITHNANGSQELYIANNRNLTQATKFWRWNVNGLAYGEKAAGAAVETATYSIAMTMDGSIVADRITSGVLRADLLDAIRIKASTFIVENETDPSQQGETLEQVFQRFSVSDQELSSEIGGLSQVAIKTVEVYYALGDSQTTAPSSSANWSTTAPEWEDGKYMWQKTKTIYADDTPTHSHVSWSDATCIQGAAGQDGDNGYNTALVYLYKRSQIAPTIDWQGSLTYYFTGQNAHHLNTVPTGWYEYIPSDSDYPLYVTVATAYSNSGSDTIDANEWSAPVMLAQNGTNGSPGTPGYNNAIIYLYKRSETTPTTNFSDITYTFSTNTLSSIPTGWYRSLDDPNIGSDAYPLWVTAASASSRTDQDIIASREWSTPIKMAQNGTNGTPGINVATILLYKRSNITPSKPTGDLTYDFETGELSPAARLNGWTKDVPAIDSYGNPCYLIQATVLSSDTEDTIEQREWTSPIIIMESGTGITSVTVTYGVSSSASSQPSSWQNDIPTVAEGQYLWTRTITDYTDSSVADTVTYTYSKQGVSGSPGHSVTIESIRYLNGASATTPPTGTWQTEPVSVPEGQYLWTRTTFSDGQVAYGVAKQGVSGAPGYNTAIIYLYKRSETTPTTNFSDITYTFSMNSLSSVPAGWYRDLSRVPESSYPIYVTAASATSASDQFVIAGTSWSTPMMLVQNGASGHSGLNSATVFLYKRSDTAPESGPNIPVLYNFNSGIASTLPDNWSKTIPPNEDEHGNHYPCYVTQATAASVEINDSILPQEWSVPVILIEDGTDGTSGYNNAIIYLYKRSETTPSQISYSGNITYTFSTDTLSSVPTGWYRDLDDSNIGSDTYPLWVTAASASSRTDQDTIGSGEWCTPIKMAQSGTNGTNGTNGRDGTPGLNSATVFMYKRAASIPTSNAAKPSGTLTYTFETGNLTPDTRYNGWLKTIPPNEDEHGNHYPCYVIQATAISTDATDDILRTEWSDPSCLMEDGSNGSNGLNVATVFLFKRSDTVPTEPSGSLTYTFATGVLTGNLNGWTQEMPPMESSTIQDSSSSSMSSSSNDDIIYQLSTRPCYVIQATASSAEPTDTILTTEWSDPVIILENGELGYSTAIAYLYRRSSTEISAVTWSNTLTYDFQAKSLTSIPTGWSDHVPDGIDPLYVTTATAFSNTNTDAIPSTDWSTPVIIAKNGTNGTPGLNAASVFLYQRADAAPQKPQSNVTYYLKDSGSYKAGDIVLASGDSNWKKNIPTSNGKPCYITQATASSTTASDTITSSEWTSPVIFVEDGSNSAPGYNTAIVYLYQRNSSASNVQKPQVNLTYNFSTTQFSEPASAYSPWQRTIPTGTNPLYVTAATAFSTSDQDTIQSSDWSDPAVLAQNGTNGSNIVTVYLYKRASATPDKPSGNVTYKFSDGTVSGSLNGWTKDIPAPDNDHNPCYVIQATVSASSTATSVTIARDKWSTQVIAFGDGIPGYSTAIVYLYKRSSTTISAVDWTTDLVYDFEDRGLVTPPTGWTEYVPSGSNPLYVTTATASSNTSQDTIEYREWATPVVLAKNGSNGDPGTPGSPGAPGLNVATVFMYKRAASTPTSTAARPSSVIRYTFDSTSVERMSPSNSNGWYSKIPNSDGNPCYVIQATASNTANTDDIQTTEWAPPTLLVEDGSNGAPGYNNGIIYLYKRSASTPTTNFSNITYTFSTNTLSTLPSGWVRNLNEIGSGTNPIWVTAASPSSNTDECTIQGSSWCAPIKMAQNGSTGSPGSPGTPGLNVATVFMYKRVASTPTGTAAKPTSSITYTFDSTSVERMSPSNSNGWYSKIPSSDGNPCYVIQATAANTAAQDVIETTEWATPTLLVEDGDDGVGIKKTNGIRAEYAISASSTSAPTTGWSTNCPTWVSGQYIWTRSHIYYDDNTDSTTTAVLDTTANQFGQSYTSLKQTVDSITLSATSGGTAVGTLTGVTETSTLKNFVKQGAYYVSTNQGIDGSASYGKLAFNFSAATSVTLKCISYGENNNDFGIISSIDANLTQNNTADTSNVYHSFIGESSPNPQIFTISVPSGSHFITFKYRKDTSTNSGDDCFKIMAYIGSSAPGTTEIKLTGTGLTASSASIDLSGTVTFSDLSGNGTTRINGANIITDTVKLSKIYLNADGAIENYTVFKTSLLTSGSSEYLVKCEVGLDVSRTNTASSWTIIYGDQISFYASQMPGSSPLEIRPDIYALYGSNYARYWSIGTSSFPLNSVYADTYYFNDTGAQLYTNSSGTGLYFRDSNNNRTLLN